MKKIRHFIFLLVFLAWGGLLLYIFFKHSSSNPEKSNASNEALKSNESEKETSSLGNSTKIDNPNLSPEFVFKTPFSMNDITNESCKSCHSEIFKEWEESYHSKAWTNIEFQARRDIYREMDCIPCHIPKPLLAQENFLIETRNKNRKTGISCLTCHLTPDGIATTSILDQIKGHAAPHPLVESKALKEDTLCIQCHRSIGNSFLKFKQLGQSCRNCHMPEVKRPNQKKGFSHIWLKRDHPKFMKTALTMKGYLEKEEIKITLTNDNVLHNIPGERHFRILLLIVEVWKNGEKYPFEQFREIIKDISIFRKERKGDKVQPRQTVVYTFPRKNGDYATIRLVYKRFPTILDHDGQVIQSLKLEFTH